MKTEAVIVSVATLVVFSMVDNLYGQLVEEKQGAPRSLGFDQDDLLSLIYGTDEIPGFECVPNPYNQRHTNIYLDVGANKEGQAIYSKISRGWKSRLFKERETISGQDPAKKRSMYELTAIVTIGESLESGRARLRSDLALLSARPRFKQTSYSGLPVGEECWTYHAQDRSGGSVRFSKGRATVLVIGGGEVQGKPLERLFVEALALGIEYRLLQRPELLAKVDYEKPEVRVGQKAIRSNIPVISYRGVTLVPLSLLERAGAKVSVTRNEKEHQAKATRGNQWVEVSAFSWEADSAGGKMKLKRPVFPYQGELIVPLRDVAEGLGFTVHAASPKRISLTPP